MTEPSSILTCGFCTRRIVMPNRSRAAPDKRELDLSVRVLFLQGVRVGRRSQLWCLEVDVRVTDVVFTPNGVQFEVEKLTADEEALLTGKRFRSSRGGSFEYI